MKRLAVVVPTYWGPVREYELGVPSPAYDHPTPLGAEGTLPRLLESLAQCRGAEFEVYLIVAPTEPGLGEAAEGRVQGIAAEFAGTMRVTVIGPSALAELKAELAEGLEAELLSLQGYGNVRNLGLAVGLLSGAEAIVFLDDDEVVEPGYLARAGAALAEVNRSGEAVGVAGPYLDQGGSPFLPEGPERGNIFLDKARYINQALRKLLQGEEKKPTPLAFGGNVVLSRSLAQKVPFDPLIPRGEDIDYVLNARLKGFRFFFDKELAVVHLPPPTRDHLKEDVVRFIYERLKLEAAPKAAGLEPIPVEELDPYPGAFLREGLEEEARKALGERGLPEGIVEEAVAFSKRALASFLEFWRGWPRVMGAIGEDRGLREHLCRKLGL